MSEAVIPLHADAGALEEARRTADLLARLQRVSSALAGAMTPGEAGQITVGAAREALEATGVVLVVPGGPGQLHSLCWDGYDDQTIRGFGSFPADSNLPAAVAMRTIQPVLIEDLATLDTAHRRVESRSLAVFPVVSQGRVLGALGFGFRSERRFAPADREFMAALADLCGQAYERALLFDAERGARAAAEAAQERANRLQTMTAALSQALTPVQVAQVAIANAMAAIGADGGSVAFLDSSGTTLELVGYSGTSLPDVVQAWERIPLETAAPISDCVRSGASIALETRAIGAARYPHLAPLWERLHIEGIVSLPLEADGRRVGAIAFVFDGPRALSADESAFLGAVCRHITLAFERARSTPRGRDRARFSRRPSGTCPRGWPSWARRAASCSRTTRRGGSSGPGPRRTASRTTEPSRRAARAARSTSPPSGRCRERCSRARRCTGKEATLITPDGKSAVVRMSAAPVPGADGLTAGAVVSMTDVTDLRRAQEAQQSLAQQAEKARAEAEDATRLKDDFLATLSHELRTPLTSILGWVRLIQLKEQDPENLARGLDTVERNARAQLQMVEDLIDVSRIVSGKLHVAFDLVDLCAVVKAALETVRPLALPRRVTLLGAGLDAKLYLRGDAGRLQQVAGNLLVNALKFTPEGGRVEVSAAREGETVRISVKDDGKGIDPAFLPHVFDRFRQAESSLNRNEGGLGLGLAIARHLVELHGGSIQAHSAGKGLGARFEVVLPGSPAQPQPRAAPPEPLLAEVSAQGIRVLVVEDDADARELLGMMLDQFGAHVSLAGSAAEGFALLESQAFDVLLSDVSMPGEDGYSFLRRVRHSSRQPGIPAGALTANARHEDRLRALEAGFQLHVPKPIEPAELVRIVGTLARGIS